MYDLFELLAKIKNKKDEISKLESIVLKEGLKKYEYLIGKYYLLAATCYIKVTNIDYIDDYGVNIECIKIQGGKHDAGHIEVNLHDDYALRFVDIDEERITEISKERFLIFLDEALNSTKDSIIKIV